MKRSDGEASARPGRHQESFGAIRWLAVAAMKLLFGGGLWGALVYALIAFVLALRLGGSQVFAANCAWVVFIVVLFIGHAVDGLESRTRR